MTVPYMILSTMTSGGQGPRVKALLRLAVKLKAPRSVNLILEETSSAGPSSKNINNINNSNNSKFLYLA